MVLVAGTIVVLSMIIALTGLTHAIEDLAAWAWIGFVILFTLACIISW